MTGRVEYFYRDIAALAFLLLLALGLAILLEGSPEGNLPGTDSGVYLYAGGAILRGQIPYIDYWDHKPPAIHYLNALGLLLGGRWGVWALGALSVILATGLGFLLVRPLGRFPAVASSVLFLISLFSITGELNGVEVYALPSSFMSLLLLRCWQQDGTRRKDIALVIQGLLAAFAFLLRQTLVGVHVAIVVVLLVDEMLIGRDSLGFLRALGCFLLGALTLLLPLTLHFLNLGAFQAFFQAAFLYNFAYSQASWFSRLKALGRGIKGLNSLFLLGAAGWAWVLFQLLKARKLGKISACRCGEVGSRLVYVALLFWFPIELALGGVSGYGFLHYFVAWLPVLSVLAAYFIQFILDRASLDRWRVGGKLTFSQGHLVLVVLLMASCFQPLFGVVSRMRIQASRLDSVSGNLAQYVQQTTCRTDRVYMWGETVRYNVLVNRLSPTRCLAWFFWTRSYTPIELSELFTSDFLDQPPILIIDFMPERGGLVPENYEDIPQLESVLDYIAKHYEPARELPASEARTIVVYRFVEY